MDFRDLAKGGREKADCNLVHLINESTFPISVPILTGRLGSYRARREKALARFCECCRQVEPEVVSKSRIKFHLAKAFSPSLVHSYFAFVLHLRLRDALP